MKIRLTMLFLIIMSLGFNLQAAELQFDRENLDESGQFDEDFIFLGSQLAFSGGARDLFFIGERLDFTGDLSLALFAFGETVDAMGGVDNGLKIGARNITVNGPVKGTSFLGGQTVRLEPGSQVVGDTFIGAKNALLEGKIRGDLYVGAGTVHIDNEIRGNVRAYAGEIRFGEEGKIIGNLTYKSDLPLSEEAKSRVSGEVVFEEKDDRFWEERHDFEGPHDSIWFWVFLKTALAVFGFILLFIPATKALEKRLDRSGILSNALWGLIPIFMYPTIILFSILLVITLPLAISMILAFLPILLVTKTLGIVLIGGYLAELLNINITNRFFYFLIGVIPYSLLSLIPYFGILLMVFLSSIGCGLLLSLLLNRQTKKVSGIRGY